MSDPRQAARGNRRVMRLLDSAGSPETAAAGLKSQLAVLEEAIAALEAEVRGAGRDASDCR